MFSLELITKPPQIGQAAVVLFVTEYVIVSSVCFLLVKNQSRISPS